MDPSYSLHARIIQPCKKKSGRRRKRKFIVMTPQYSSLKYKCYQCNADVYFLPGHELVCSNCASRIVTKVRDQLQKRIVSAR